METILINTKGLFVSFNRNTKNHTVKIKDRDMVNLIQPPIDCSELHKMNSDKDHPCPVCGEPLNPNF